MAVLSNKYLNGCKVNEWERGRARRMTIGRVNNRGGEGTKEKGGMVMKVLKII
jgi:hypothetical protein